MRKIFTFALLLSLASCSAEYQAKQKQAQYNADSAKCQSYGAKVGNSDFIQCMATIESGRQTTIVREPVSIGNNLWYRY